MGEKLAILAALILVALSGWAVALSRSKRYGAASALRRTEKRRADHAEGIANRRGGAILTAAERQAAARDALAKRRMRD